MTDKRTFHCSVDNFDKQYRGELLVDGKPGIRGVPWTSMQRNPSSWS
jgi:hypothetical protein